MITESIVARAGANIPAPLAIPENVACPTLTLAILGWVSVVIIALAMGSKAPSTKVEDNAVIPERIFSIGRNSPIRPVEHTATSEEETFNSRATEPARS